MNRSGRVGVLLSITQPRREKKADAVSRGKLSVAVLLEVSKYSHRKILYFAHNGTGGFLRDESIHMLSEKNLMMSVLYS